MSTYHAKIETRTLIKIEQKIIDHPMKGIVSPDNKFYFHLIPKNASRFISGNLQGLGWTPVYENKNFDYKHKLIILRDPISRWVSGIIEFFHLNNLITDNFEKDWEIYKKLLIHQPVQDAHTIPQVEFLVGVPLDDMEFLYIPENLDNIGPRVQQWLSNKGYGNDFHKYDVFDNSSKNQIKAKVLDIVKHTAYVDQKFRASLKEYYRSSYDLINWVSETEKWI